MTHIPRKQVTFRRGSRRALARAARRWGQGVTSTPETPTRFRCLGCDRWTKNEDGGAEAGPAGLCCSGCAMPILDKEDRANAAG